MARYTPVAFLPSFLLDIYVFNIIITRAISQSPVRLRALNGKSSDEKKGGAWSDYTTRPKIHRPFYIHQLFNVPIFEFVETGVLNDCNIRRGNVCSVRGLKTCDTCKLKRETLATYR